jgi:hypothetical protein
MSSTLASTYGGVWCQNYIHKRIREHFVADILSRYPTTNDPKVEKPIPTKMELSKVFATNNNIPADAFPLSFQILSAMQQQDPLTETLFTKPGSTNDHLSQKTFHGGEQLACYDEKIYGPLALRNNVVT